MVPALTTGYLTCWVGASLVSAWFGKRLSVNAQNRRESSLGWSMLAGAMWPLLVVGIVEIGIFVAVAAVWRSRENAARGWSPGAGNRTVALHVVPPAPI